MTSRSRSQALKERIKTLNEYLMGWITYFSLADAQTILITIDQWLRRRMRMVVWKQWKSYRMRVRELRAHGVPEWQVRKAAGARRGCWFVAGSAALNKALGNAYWQAQGLLSLSERYRLLRQAQ